MKRAIAKLLAHRKIIMGEFHVAIKKQIVTT